ncbi:hypothetical protein J8I29_24615 [Labrys sp. LIt4]|uniref:hypothetical protein n=1 Tax=Labrys sp. LIt4 TaxID=2821355 RepID=UPI001ADFCF92|nr:hypothetical protein [Labrys sp. LIt4]MBP0582533.1 hypothetical protein [Labrys sp. LIt4]
MNDPMPLGWDKAGGAIAQEKEERAMRLVRLREMVNASIEEGGVLSDEEIIRVLDAAAAELTAEGRAR